MHMYYNEHRKYRFSFKGSDNFVLFNTKQGDFQCLLHDQWLMLSEKYTSRYLSSLKETMCYRRTWGKVDRRRAWKVVSYLSMIWSYSDEAKVVFNLKSQTPVHTWAPTEISWSLQHYSRHTKFFIKYPWN